jgi:6-pyruvoyltetrahydropterin/6-carboxytetrahydropterin synthase
MRVSVTRVFDVSCGHHLPRLPDGHKCRRPHGHNYEIHVTVRGEPDETGMVVEAGALDAMVRPVLLKIDHHVLNELTLSTRAGAALVANPTVEHLAIWLYESLGFLWSASPPRTLTYGVRVWETRRFFAEVGSP